MRELNIEVEGWTIDVEAQFDGAYYSASHLEPEEFPELNYKIVNITGWGSFDDIEDWILEEAVCRALEEAIEDDKLEFELAKAEEQS